MACRDLLIWVGQPKKRSVILKETDGGLEPVYTSSRYSKIDGYIKEASEMGCCRRIPQLPSWVVPGESRVFLVHKGNHKSIERGSIFGYFIVKRAEYITEQQGPGLVKPATGQIPWSDYYYSKFIKAARSCRGLANEPTCIRNKLPKSLKLNFPREVSRGRIKYRRPFPKSHYRNKFLEMLKDILEEYIKECWEDFLESYDSRDRDYELVPGELSDGAGGLACSKRHVPGAVYLVNALYSEITDAFHDKFYHWLECEGPSKYPSLSREELIAELKKTERNPNAVYPEEGIELYRQARKEVLEKGIPEAGKLILFKQPYPIFQRSPSAAFRGYRRIDGDMLLEQIRNGVKQVTPVIPYCSGIEIDPDKPLTKSQLVAHFAKELGLHKATTGKFFIKLSDLAIDQLKRNKSMVLPGLGKLVVSERKERYGRNPGTGEKILIPARNVVRLRVTKKIKDELNS